MGQHVWQEARKNNDFATFAPLLTKMVDLKRQQAEALGYAETPYDALLDEFEPGELTSRVTAVLGALRDELVPLVGQIRDGGRSPDLSILERSYPIEVQRSFGRAAAAKIGFDFERGRLDVTAHPFCTGLGPNDCRITTRYDEHFFNAGFFGILHEAGHGIYDQGLRPDQYGLPVGEAVSMGIHESQSRLWEILVGRSLPFWRHMYPEAKRAFAGALGDVTLGRFYFAVNDVRPSLIRVEADEYTYNLHILIRFELEQALIKGDLSVNDLQLAWQDKYREYLGIEVPSDADGVLQDIHWSAGLFGYFPTYSLGNLYAAQFYEQADQELGGLDQRFTRGEFGLLKRWLQAKIHRQGQRYTAAELCERVTGKALSHEPLMRHLRKKYELLYAPEAAPLDDLDVAVEPSATAAVEHGEGYGLAADAGFGVASFGESVGGFGGASVGGSTVSAPAYRRKKEGGLVTAIILLGGIVGGGILGTSLGYWILLWWKGPSADFLHIRDSLPSWIVPAGPAPEVEPIPVVPPNAPPASSSSRRTIDDVGRTLAQRILQAAQQRG
jgi:carboxypeptidase Taq